MILNDCLGKIPYNSVVGFILILIGGGLSSIATFKSIMGIEEIFQRFFFPIYELPYAKFISITLAIAVIILACVILTYSVLVTSATKGKVLRSENCLMGGKNSALFFLALCLSASFIWVIVALLLTIPNIMWFIITRKCIHETEGRWSLPSSYKPNVKLENQLIERENMDIRNIFTQNHYFSFNLTNYGIYLKTWNKDPRKKYNEAITEYGNFQEFCTMSYSTGIFSACALCGAIMVLCGLAVITPALASYYTKIQLSKELTKYKTTSSLLKTTQQSNDNEY